MSFGLRVLTLCSDGVFEAGPAFATARDGGEFSASVRVYGMYGVNSHEFAASVLRPAARESSESGSFQHRF